MSYRLILDLEGLPKMANHGSGASTHWRFAHSETMYWQTAVKLKVGILKPEKPLAKAKLTLIRYSSTEPDFDGLVRGFKAVVDGLVKAGVLENDRISNTGVWNCFWEKTGPKQGRIKIIVEEWI